MNKYLTPQHLIVKVLEKMEMKKKKRRSKNKEIHLVHPLFSYLILRKTSRIWWLKKVNYLLKSQRNKLR
jgi:hypothetical protein